MKSPTHIRTRYNQGKAKVSPRTLNTVTNEYKTLICFSGTIIAMITVPTTKIKNTKIKVIKIEDTKSFSGCRNRLMNAAFSSIPV